MRLPQLGDQYLLADTSLSSKGNEPGTVRKPVLHKWHFRNQDPRTGTIANSGLHNSTVSIMRLTVLGRQSYEAGTTEPDISVYEIDTVPVLWSVLLGRQSPGLSQ